jgi:hypothetical protein
MRYTALLLLLAVTANASAQIDHRVNTGNDAAGQSMDANTQVGSYGLNLTRPGLYDNGVSANAVVTNNVTGLAGFHGYSPVQQTSGFRENLPSAGISDFLSRSVGVNELPNFSDPRPTLFMGRQQTVTDAGYARSNPFSAPSLGATNIASPSRFIPTFVNNRSAKVPNPADSRLQGPAGVESFGIRQTPMGRPGAATPARSAALFNNAVSSPIFGLQPAATSNTTPGARPIMGQGAMEALRDYRVAEEDDDDPLRQFERRHPDGLNNPFTDSGTAKKGLNNPFGPVEKKDKEKDKRAAVSKNIGVSQQPLNPTPVLLETGTPANLGADRFADLYNAVKVAESAGVKQFGFQAGTKISKEEPAAAEEVAPAEPPKLPPVRDALVRSSGEGIAQLAAHQRWAGNALEDPITTFAGKFKNELNQAITTAEISLQNGKFYQAARQFEIASTIDPRNPLPLLGMGHALVAAGDYASGTRSILRGIERFPQIAAFRMDLPAIVGNQDIFDRRRADLTTKLERQDDPELRFLLGYLELYSGLSAEGFRDLELAAAKSAPESTIAKFYKVTSGKDPLPPVSDE